jgi:glycosyltransferase involved in cell wall biosynthesis
MARLLAEAGETVHVVAQRWNGASQPLQELCDGRLIVHRVSMDADPACAEAALLAGSDFPAQCFSWRAALLAESLVETAGVDVIEAQEWEAPLYYFQLRRALGLGPGRRPPCVVHLHSPTEFIFRSNEWGIDRPDYLPMKRMEDYTIGAADAILCPSRYLAREATAHYALAPDAVTVIPYPIGDTPLVDRPPDVWASGPVCYVGRLEPRKGVAEWVDAAVQVAAEDPRAEFEFVGADLPYYGTVSMRQHAERRIPAALRSRFHFRGSRSRAEVREHLAHARAAVVPSRWENFPNTCIEAMCSGLPVIASRDGGMVEMIEDGRTGWLAPQSGAAGLASALRRALATPPAQLAAMGRAAAAAIRELCDNDVTVRRHIEFRRDVAARGVERSLRLPAGLPAGLPGAGVVRKTAAAPPPAGRAPRGIALVVTGLNGASEACLASIRGQTLAPAAVVVVDDASAARDSELAVRLARSAGWIVRELRGASSADAKNAGAEAALAAATPPLALAFVDAHSRLRPDHVAACEQALRHAPDAGVVSFWTAIDGGARHDVHPCPAFPYQLLANEVAPSAAVRAEAYREVGGFRSALDGGFEQWDLVNAVMAAGWAAVTYPAVLAESATGGDPLLRPDTVPGHSRMRRAVLARTPDPVARCAADLVLLLEARESAGLHARRRAPHGAAALASATGARPPGAARSAPARPVTAAALLWLGGRAIRDPRRAVRRLAWHARAAARGAARRAARLVNGARNGR